MLISPLYNIKLDVFHFVQRMVEGDVWAEGHIQRWKKVTEEWEYKVKKNEEVIKKLEKKREHYEGELVLISMPYKLTWIHWIWDIICVLSNKMLSGGCGHSMHPVINNVLFHVC